MKQGTSNEESSRMLDIRRAVGGYKSSTKIDALVRHLQQYIEEGRRTVVFSQYTAFLDMIQVALKLHDISYVRFDGTLSQAQREKVLAKFSAKYSGGEDGSGCDNKEQPPMVMLISLRAGGVGLNLTCASRAVMMVRSPLISTSSFSHYPFIGPLVELRSGSTGHRSCTSFGTTG